MEHYRRSLQDCLSSSIHVPELQHVIVDYIGWDIGECVHFTLPFLPVHHIQQGRIASLCIDTKNGVIERLLVRFKRTPNAILDDLIWIPPAHVVVLLISEGAEEKNTADNNTDKQHHKRKRTQDDECVPFI